MSMDILNSRSEWETKFWSRVHKTDTCWLWTNGTKGGSWYGQFMFKGKMYRTHRLSWMMHFGAIPKGLLVCHKCDIPGCINPDHLFLGTHADNSRDASAKKRTYGPHHGNFAKGSRHHKAKLNEDIVRHIRRLHKQGMRGSEIADSHGINRSVICEVLSGKAWAHVPFE